MPTYTCLLQSSCRWDTNTHMLYTTDHCLYKFKYLYVYIYFLFHLFLTELCRIIVPILLWSAERHLEWGTGPSTQGTVTLSLSHTVEFFVFIFSLSFFIVHFSYSLLKFNHSVCFVCLCGLDHSRCGRRGIKCCILRHMNIADTDSAACDTGEQEELWYSQF